MLAAPGRASERSLQALTTVVAEHPVPRARAPTREVLRRYLAPACAAALELWPQGHHIGEPGPVMVETGNVR